MMKPGFHFREFVVFLVSEETESSRRGTNPRAECLFELAIACEKATGSTTIINKRTFTKYIHIPVAFFLSNRGSLEANSELRARCPGQLSRTKGAPLLSFLDEIASPFLPASVASPCRSIALN